MTSFQKVSYEPADRAGLFELMHEVWGSYLSEEEFDWWFERNPTGPRLISLAREDGLVVGALAMSFARMRLGGQEHLAAFAVQGATHPGYRRRGIFPTLELWNEEQSAEAGAPVAVGFTNPEAGPILVRSVGWSDVERLRLWARPLRLRRTGHGELGSPSGGRRYGSVRVEPLERFGPDAEAVYREAAPGYPDHVVRDQAYLNWRFVDSPRSYRCFGAYRGERLSGFAVLGHKVHRGVSAAVLADLVAPPGAFGVARALLRRCLVDARGNDALIALPPPRQRLAFTSLGFVPAPMTIRLIGKALTPEARLPERPGQWYFSLGDTDIF